MHVIVQTKNVFFKRKQNHVCRKDNKISIKTREKKLTKKWRELKKNSPEGRQTKTTSKTRRNFKMAIPDMVQAETHWHKKQTRNHIRDFWKSV